MAPGEQKANLVGKPIDTSKAEPQWFAPSVPKKSFKAPEKKIAEISEIEVNEETEDIPEFNESPTAAVPVITSVGKPIVKPSPPLSKDFTKNPFMGSKSEETPKFASKVGSAPFSPSPVNQKGASMGAFFLHQNQWPPHQLFKMKVMMENDKVVLPVS